MTVVVASKRYSVIVPCYNEAHNLTRMLDSVRVASKNRDSNTLEVLVIDNGSQDGSDDIARAGGAVVLCANRVSISRLRNLGAEAAQGEVLLFLDADMEVPPDWLDRIDEALAAGADALGFVEQVPREAPWYAQVWSQRIAARRSHDMPVDYLPGRNIAVRRQLYLQVGGFSEALATGEDKDLSLRLIAAGASINSVAGRPMMHWGYERSFSELLRKEFWRQSSHIDLLARHGASVRLMRFPVASVAVLAFLCIGLVAVAVQQWQVALLSFFLSFLPAVGVTFSRGDGLRFRPVAAAQLVFLYWVRFQVAGLSVLRALWLRATTRRSPRP
ncbi:MAG: glycosyltransferase [Pseudomonadota bacterium]|nr:glycosyltransferase [Pseudomonadota bacterium]